MAQQTQYTVQGLPGQIRVFLAKTKLAVPITAYTVQGIPGQRFTFSTKTAADIITAAHMRSMRVGIEYESVLEDITPDDATDLTAIGMLYIGTTGDVQVTGSKEGTVILKNVASGTWLNFIRVSRVWSTNTTATDIVLAR